MNKKVYIFVLMALMLLLATGLAPGPLAQTRANIPDAQINTPTPDGQIVVPSFTLQINPPGPNPLENKADANNRVAGPLLGIWHGIISPITLVMSFINPDVQMYEVHNEGSAYNLGFLLGVAVVFLLLGGLAGSSRRRR